MDIFGGTRDQAFTQDEKRFHLENTLYTTKKVYFYKFLSKAIGTAVLVGIYYVLL